MQRHAHLEGGLQPNLDGDVGRRCLHFFGPLARRLDFARGRVPRYIAGFFLACVSIAGGEGFDWYYASAMDRTTGTRTPITDGAYGERLVEERRVAEARGAEDHPLGATGAPVRRARSSPSRGRQDT